MEIASIVRVPLLYSPGQAVGAIAPQQPHAAHLGAFRVLPEGVRDGSAQRVIAPQLQQTLPPATSA